jgi:hypothetical protein
MIPSVLARTRSPGNTMARSIDGPSSAFASIPRGDFTIFLLVPHAGVEYAAGMGVRGNTASEVGTDEGPLQ